MVVIEKDEKRLALFRKALPTIIVATIIVAVAMTGYGWYKNRIVEHNKEIGDMFIDLASGQVDDVFLRNMLDYVSTKYQSLDDSQKNEIRKIFHEVFIDTNTATIVNKNR